MYATITRLFLLLAILPSTLCAQDAGSRLAAAYERFEQDSQLAGASASLYVVNAQTGQVVFARNETTGLAPASTQKIITAATAYELLGRDFRYQTVIGFDPGGNLYVTGAGDPTLGSSRWKQTGDTAVLGRIVRALKRNGISRIRGDLWIDDLRFDINPVPDGWIWQDMGNYYGAGAWSLNWRENQYDLVLKPGEAVGELTSIIKTVPAIPGFTLYNRIRTGKKGSGDNGYIYAAPYSTAGFATGTIPEGVPSFTISGSLPHPPRQFGAELFDALSAAKLPVGGRLRIYSDSLLARAGTRRATQLLDSLASPPLDSMIYWFLRRSINLYGEALLRTLAYRNDRSGTGAAGAGLVRRYWKEKGIPETDLHLVDGSGLSPLNRVTTRAQVAVLQYARQREWFGGYYLSFPEYNGMKMKSGTISGAKGFCGYHTARDGSSYVFSLLVNNYNGSASSLVQKMYRVLDELK